MQIKTAKASDKQEDFCLDVLAGTAAPELQIAIQNSEPAEFKPQLEFDNMPIPTFAISVETDSSEPQQLHFRNAQNLLESLESQQIEVPYQCRDGYCGACRCKKTSGDVMYLQEPMAWINDDEILPCISIPTSDLSLTLKG